MSCKQFYGSSRPYKPANENRQKICQIYSTDNQVETGTVHVVAGAAAVISDLPLADEVNEDNEVEMETVTAPPAAISNLPPANQVQIGTVATVEAAVISDLPPADEVNKDNEVHRNSDTDVG